MLRSWEGSRARSVLTLCIKCANTVDMQISFAVIFVSKNRYSLRLEFRFSNGTIEESLLVRLIVKIIFL